jgi:hypothetical protein
VSRPYRDYTLRPVAVDPRSVGAPAFDPDVPIPGFYRFKLRAGAMFAPVRIWYGPPRDPETGEEMDRSHRWQAEAGGHPIDLARVWPKCARDTISEQEFAYLFSRQEWGEAHAPGTAVADPTVKIDLLRSPLPF